MEDSPIKIELLRTPSFLIKIGTIEGGGNMLVKINGENLAAIRKKRRYTRSDLAEKAGIALRTLASYESGEIQSCKSDTIVNLAKILDVDYTMLMLDQQSNLDSWRIHHVFESIENTSIKLPENLENALDPLSTESMRMRVCAVLDYVYILIKQKEFCGTKFLYYHNLKIYYSIGNYFVNSLMVDFIKDSRDREKRWSLLISALESEGEWISENLVEKLREYRVKSHEERRNLLVYLYYYTLERYENYYVNRNQDQENEMKIYHIIVLICSMLEGSENLIQVDINNFCATTSFPLVNYIDLKRGRTSLALREKIYSQYDNAIDRTASAYIQETRFFELGD